MMPELMEYIAVYCDYVAHCATPKFKMAESQTEVRTSSCVLTTETRFINALPSNTKKYNSYYIVIRLLLLSIILQLV